MASSETIASTWQCSLPIWWIVLVPAFPSAPAPTHIIFILWPYMTLCSWQLSIVYVYSWKTCNCSLGFRNVTASRCIYTYLLLEGAEYQVKDCYWTCLHCNTSKVMGNVTMILWPLPYTLPPPPPWRDDRWDLKVRLVIALLVYKLNLFRAHYLPAIELAVDIANLIPLFCSTLGLG